VYRVKDSPALSLLVLPSQHPEEYDLLYEIVAVFSLPAFSGGTIPFAAFRLYKLQHVLPRHLPYDRNSISQKGKEFQFYPNKMKYPAAELRGISFI